MLGHALCHALSFHSQTISHSITNNRSSVETIPSSSFEDRPIVMGVDLVPLHYSYSTLYLNNSLTVLLSACPKLYVNIAEPVNRAPDYV